jgi:hypothetical protein
MPAMSCATLNVRCWWCGTRPCSDLNRNGGSGYSEPVPTSDQVRGRLSVENALTDRLKPLGRAGHHLTPDARLLPEPPSIRINRKAAHRVLDLTAHQPDVVQFAIVHLPKRYDTGSAIQISGQRVGPHCNPANKPTERARPCGLGCALRHRGHCRHHRHPSSPLASAWQSGTIGANTDCQRLRPERLRIACAPLSAIEA